MSFDLVVYLTRERMPPVSTWHWAIRRAGFSADLATDFDVDAFHGFLSCRVDGELSGFEYHPSVVPQEDVDELELAPGTDFSVRLSVGARPLEFVSAHAASSVLAELSGGHVFDPQSGKSIPGERAVQWAKGQIARAGLASSRPSAGPRRD